MAEDRWELAGLSLHSRVLLGTARYPSRQVLLDALAASGTELVTVAVRRVGLGAGGENLYDALRAKESRRSPWLGFSVLELTRENRTRRSPRTGIYIDGVFDPSPASRAGIRVGDVLTAIDDQRVLSVADFQKSLYLAGIGATVRLHVSRDGEALELPATIEERPEAARPVDPTASPAP